MLPSPRGWSLADAAHTLGPMSKGQMLTFAILGAALTFAGLAWGILWAIRTWRKAGAEVSAELGQGSVDEHGNLHVFFMDGRSTIFRVDGDPWKRREKALGRARSRGKKRTAAARSQGLSKLERQAVNVVIARNSGRAAITVTRCFYLLELAEFTFRGAPPPSISPWGDLLPKRIEAGEEIILLHDKKVTWEVQNVVMRDHGVFQTIYGVYLELGDGRMVFARPPIMTQATMTDDEYAEVEKRVQREPYEAPAANEPGQVREKVNDWRRDRELRGKLIMESEVHPDDLRAIRSGESAEWLADRPIRVAPR